MDTGKTYSVLFLCTGNSARSILAESILNHVGGGKFRGFSAGSHPKGEVHPVALDLLRAEGMPTSGLRSKGWDEFAMPDPAAVDGDVMTRKRAFRDAFHRLGRRIGLFVALPIAQLDGLSLQRKVEEIGKTST
jgi:arsenate reductase